MQITGGHKRTIITRVRFDLAQKFPNTFAPKGAPKKPLKIGIFYDLRKAMPNTPYLSLKAALGDYCSGPSYQMSLVFGAARYDLEGKVCGEVSRGEADHAAEIVAGYPDKVREKWSVMQPFTDEEKADQYFISNGLSVVLPDGTLIDPERL